MGFLGLLWLLLLGRVVERCDKVSTGGEGEGGGGVADVCLKEFPTRLRLKEPVELVSFLVELNCWLPSKSNPSWLGG